MEVYHIKPWQYQQKLGMLSILYKAISTEACHAILDCIKPLLYQPKLGVLFFIVSSLRSMHRGLACYSISYQIWQCDADFHQGLLGMDGILWHGWEQEQSVRFRTVCKDSAQESAVAGGRGTSLYYPQNCKVFLQKSFYFFCRVWSYWCTHAHLFGTSVPIILYYDIINNTHISFIDFQ